MAATLVASLSAFGESVSGDDARNAVTGWVRLREALGDEIVAEPESVATYHGQDGIGEFHVVSLKGGGYVITSGDTSITPILGYSKTGTFDADENSPQWALLTADVAARAAELEAPAGSASAGGANTTAIVQLQQEEPGGNHDKWARLVSASKRGGRLLSAKLTSPPADLRVASFIRSKWGQQDAKSGNGYSHYYYSYYTPYNWPCGCVATAQAQIMRYFEWPKTPVEARTFTCATNEVAVSLTMKGGTYDWTHMPYNPIEVSYDWNNVIGIAKLTYDVGVTVEMSYKSTGRQRPQSRASEGMETADLRGGRRCLLRFAEGRIHHNDKINQGNRLNNETKPDKMDCRMCGGDVRGSLRRPDSHDELREEAS